MSNHTYHYTYLITNLQPLDTQKYYIGVHSGNINPDHDGYMGSSKTLSEVMRSKLGYFEKIIIEKWDTRTDAVAHEIELHAFYNVKDNPLFYNKANQTSTGFDTSGTPMHENTRAGLLLANTGRVCPDIVKKLTSERNQLPSNPWRKENRTALMGNEFNSDTARACALNRVREGRHNFQNANESHPQFKGYYCTPHGRFTSAPKAAHGGICAYDVRYYCNNPDKIISIKRAKRSPVMTTDDIGKTFKEIGFWFEPV